MKALISPIEQKADDSGNIVGVRVVEKNLTGFDVASPLFWIECEDTIVPDDSYYDTVSKTIKTLPGYPKKDQGPITPIDEYTEV